MATALAEREQARLGPKMALGPNRGAGAARIGLGLALAGLSALLATWAFPPYGIWPLIFVAWVPMLVAQHRVLPRRWSWVAVAIAIGGYVAGYLHGVVDPSFAWWVACIPLVVALGAGIGAVGARNFDEATGYVFFVFTFPLIWTALEFLRGFTPGIGTQGYLAYTLFKEPWLLQPVSVLGVNALNLLILVVNWTIGLGVLMLLERRRPPGSRLISRRVMAVSGIFCMVAAGVWVCTSLLMFRTDPSTVTVAAIQPGLPGPGSVHASRNLAEDLHRDIAQTRRAAKEGAKLVVWQEGILKVDPQDNPIGHELSELARDTHVYLVVGYRFVTARGQHNDATVIAPSGRYLGVYGKEHPALMFAADQQSVDAGTMPVYQTPFGRLATMICFDADYTDTARSAALHGAQVVAVPSQDPQGDATKHYGLLVFRAIENRLTMVRDDFAYGSAIIDPYGRIVASAITPQGSQATLLVKVPIGSGHSPLVDLGNLWGWVIVAGAVVAVVLGARSLRRGSSDATSR
ncbi:MAG TPA: nitrilase-related carbon-nitrogen hydrolase [Acidimicrobiales bacterium]|nr:nitrilase-related carbon-nitrogen hydrolase [Acidimicrobiales bacterium]